MRSQVSFHRKLLTSFAESGYDPYESTEVSWKIYEIPKSQTSVNDINMRFNNRLGK